MTDRLLAPDALAGRTVAVSVSDSPDLGTLGLMESHLRLALGEIARAVFIAGGSLAYGGNLKPDGYTPFLVDEFMRWERPPTSNAAHAGEPPAGPRLLLCLAWTVHRQTPRAGIRQFEQDLGAYGDVVCLTPAGEKDQWWWQDRGEEPVTTDPDQAPAALTGMRTWMTKNSTGRVLLGGKRAGFQGRYPGLIEEAVLALAAEQPVYLAGGFGGVTLDIIQTLDVDVEPLLPPRADSQTVDPRLLGGVEQLRTLAAGRGWPVLRNGLTDEENRQLAATHRPSEIAALVSRGMGLVTPRDREGPSADPPR